MTPAGAPALQALKSGVVVSCNPTFTYEATIKYKAEISNVGLNEVCVKTTPNYVTLKVTSEAEGLTSVSTSESKIDCGSTCCPTESPTCCMTSSTTFLTPDRR